MFTLWYTVLSWKEYRDSICKSLSAKPTPENPNRPAVQLPTKKPEESKVDPPKSQPNEPITIPKQTPKPFQKITPQTPPVQQPKPASPQPPSPAPASPLPPSSPVQKNAPFRPTPPKNVRSQSPHPMSTDAFSDISFEDEESDPEEDNSVIDSPWVPQKPKKPDDTSKFLTQEISNQRNQLSPGSGGPSGFQNPRNVSPKGPRQS